MNRFGHGQAPSKGRALYRTKSEAEAALLKCSRDACELKSALRRIREYTVGDNAFGKTDAYRLGAIDEIARELLERFHGAY